MRAEQSPDAARLAWFSAPDQASRDGCVGALVGLAMGSGPWPARQRAITHLIELLHLSGHPSERLRLVTALGRLESPVVVPALHAELHHPDPAVRRAALRGIGELGYGFGGALVASWLEARDIADEPPGIADTALHALARTGHAAVEDHAAELWTAGLVSARALHLALTDAVSPAMLDLARAHVSSSEAAVAAALHLAARRIDDLADALSPLLRSPDLAHVHLAERILDLPNPSAEDELLSLLDRRWRLGPLGRAARRLRVHDPGELREAFAALRDGEPRGSWPRRMLLRCVLLVGAPTLQADALDWLEAEGDVDDLAYALQFAAQPTPQLRSRLGRLMGHPADKLAVQALRLRCNVFGDLEVEALGRIAAGPRGALACEAVRGLMNRYRDRRGPDGKTGVRGVERGQAEALLRHGIREGSEDTRKLATYAVGNIGLTGLTDDLRRLREDPDPAVRQGAAASLHVLPPSVPAADLLAQAEAEPDPDVRFRLGLCLLQALGAGDQLDGGSLAAFCAGSLSDRADLAVLGLRLRGFAGDPGAAQALSAAAASAHLATASAALTALGTLADPATLPALQAALDAGDPQRRRRAVESLERFQGPAAGDLLVNTAGKDGDEDVRRVALEVLARRPAAPEAMARLHATGPTDPLLFELLQARAAAAGGRRDAGDLDADLVEAIPGFRPGRLRRRCPAALQALRTAEFLTGAVTLPAGLDAAPPALFWVKGLELWLDVELRSMQQALRQRPALEALEGAKYRWSALQGQVDRWRDRGTKEGWSPLLGTLTKRLSRRNAEVMSLTAVAAMLLVTGPLARTLGLPAGLAAGPPDTVSRISVELVDLARDRNRLTHRTAGSAAEVEAVRARALGVARWIAARGR